YRRLARSRSYRTHLRRRRMHPSRSPTSDPPSAPEAPYDGRHLLRDAPRNDHQVGLARRRAENFGTEARYIVLGRGRGHHLDRAACEPHRQRPHAGRLRPARDVVELGQEKLPPGHLVYRHWKPPRLHTYAYPIAST